MTYISREAAIAALGEIHPLDYNVQSEKRRIEAIPAADVVERPRWIPVTERLPEIKEHHVSDTVLVYLADGGMAFDELEENIFGQSWFSCEHLPDVEGEMRVTHWMPLPEPPKEEAPAGPYDLLYEEGGPDA